MAVRISPFRHQAVREVRLIRASFASWLQLSSAARGPQPSGGNSSPMSVNKPHVNAEALLRLWRIDGIVDDD